MNITREVIKDLLPAYFSGDVSADTRNLVEEYFRQDQAFEREARRSAAALQAIGEMPTVPPDSKVEKTALKRSKNLLRIQTILLALASTFSLNAFSLGFSFEIGNGRTRIHWLALPGQSAWVVAILTLAVVLWILYFLVRRHVRTRVLG